MTDMVAVPTYKHTHTHTLTQLCGLFLQPKNLKEDLGVYLFTHTSHIPTAATFCFFRAAPAAQSTFKRNSLGFGVLLKDTWTQKLQWLVQKSGFAT